MSENQELHKKDQAGWDDRWNTNNTPFDKGSSHSALHTLLSKSGTEGYPVIPKKGRALVAGCGRGYDVHTLASRGLDTTGLEISPKAVEEANTWLQSQQPQPSAQAKVELADFFTLKPPEGVEGYDVFYDYTFLCALPPTLRPSWSSSYLSLSHPSSLLITLQYPLDGPERKTGPPYSLSHELYLELLGKEWEVVWERGVGFEERRDGGLGREEWVEGRERIVVWRRRG